MLFIGGPLPNLVLTYESLTLEDEVSRLTRQEERRTRRLEKLRCQKCLVKVDVRALEHRLMADER